MLHETQNAQHTPHTPKAPHANTNAPKHNLCQRRFDQSDMSDQSERHETSVQNEQLETSVQNEQLMQTGRSHQSGFRWRTTTPSCRRCRLGDRWRRRRHQDHGMSGCAPFFSRSQRLAGCECRAGPHSSGTGGTLPRGRRSSESEDSVMIYIYIYFDAFRTYCDEIDVDSG